MICKIKSHIHYYEICAIPPPAEFASYRIRIEQAMRQINRTSHQAHFNFEGVKFGFGDGVCFRNDRNDVYLRRLNKPLI